MNGRWGLTVLMGVLVLMLGVWTVEITAGPPEAVVNPRSAVLTMGPAATDVFDPPVDPADPSADPSADPAPSDTPPASVPAETDATSETTAAPETTEPRPQPIPMPARSAFESVALQVEPTGIDIEFLTGMVWNEQEDAYYAISQDGIVYRIDRSLDASEPVLDLTAETTELLPGSERGMLGIAFAPGDGRLFLYFTDRGDDTNVISMAMADGRPDPATRRLVMFVEQPGLGHKAGDMQFDTAGNLFVALGDGGGSRGRDAQDGSKLLGKILRVVPRADADGYDVPADNPFVGNPEIRPEIWALGLRNPWQFHLDPATGDMYIGDVGESDVEEIDVIPAGTSGQNFGWYWYEGTRNRGIGEPPAGVEVTPPVHEYPHSVGPAVIAGPIYTGEAITALRGAYVFGDMSGPLFAMGDDGAARLGVNVPGVITTIAETPEGELLFTTLQGGVHRLLPG